MPRLYQLEERYRCFRGMLESETSIISNQELLDALDSVKDDIEDKAENIGKIILELKSDVEAIELECDRLTNRSQTFRHKMEWLKGYLLEVMQTVGIQKIKREVLTVSVRDNPPSVEAADLEQLAPEYIRVIPETREANKKAILDYYKQTSTIPEGVTLQLNKKHLEVK